MPSESMGIIETIRRRSSAFLFGRRDSSSSSKNEDGPYPEITINDFTAMGILQEIRRRSSTFLYGTETFASLLAKAKENSDDSDDSLPYFVGYLTEAMIEQAEEELNETDDTRTNGLNEMRKLLKDKGNFQTDDAFLLQFLRARKFNAKNAFTMLQKQFAHLKTYKDIFTNFDFDKLMLFFRNNVFGFLPKRDRGGSVIVLFRIGQWDPEINSFDDLVRVIAAMSAVAIEDPATQVTGFRIIIDSRGMGWKQVRFLTAQNILILTKVTQFCFPARYKAIHILSDSRLFNAIMFITYPFLTSKLRSRVLNHGQDVKALQKYIHPSILPLGYGGGAGPCNFSFWEDIIKQRKEDIVRILKYGYE